MSGSPQQKRPRTEISQKVYAYFERDDEQDSSGINKFRCKTCKSKVSGSKLYNLVSHLRHIHSEKYDEIYVPKDGSAVPLSVRQLNLLHNLVEIVSVNGRPFKSILDSGFQSIIRDEVNKLKEGGYGLTLSNGNMPEVKNKLHDMATKVRNKIKNEVQGKPISLLCDIVTKNRRSIFGISIQYIVNGKLRVRSIGMVELLESHTGTHLAAVVVARLKMYEIDLKHILTITTDNGSNILKMVRDFDEILQDIISNDVHFDFETPAQSSSNSVTLQTDEAISALLVQMEHLSDEDAIQKVMDGVLLKHHDSLLTAMSKKLVDEVGLNILWDVTGIHCAAHTLQLAIQDALKKISPEHQNVISLARAVAKTLRRKSMLYEINHQFNEFRVPRLECDTRWGTLYLMVRVMILRIFMIF